jgi:hypothetical protein
MPAAALLAIASCTDAVGIEACRSIETARCQSAQHCGFSEDESLRCVEFYHDQCLHGIENADEPPGETETKQCVDAIAVVDGCAQKGAATMADCPQAPVIASAPAASLTPCGVILKSAHLLAACAFVSKTEPSSTIPAPDSGSNDSGSDSGDAAGE